MDKSIGIAIVNHLFDCKFCRRPMVSYPITKFAQDAEVNPLGRLLIVSN